MNLREAAQLALEESMVCNHRKKTEAIAALEAEPVMPSYGQVPWGDLIAALGEARGTSWVPSDDLYIGHQMAGINMNSLNRIVSKFLNAAPQAPKLEAEPRKTLLDEHAEQVEREEAEPQEPVATVFQPEQGPMVFECVRPLPNGTKLYAHPAPAPMPDWEILKIGDSCLKYESNARDDELIAFARAVRGEA